MVDIASLGISVDSSQVTRATEETRRLAQESANAGRAVDSIANSSSRSAKALNNLVASQQRISTGLVTQSGLARHELVNLSRQIQDVGVSLASGQSPFLVMIQQGTQIADVFGTTQGTARGMFAQIASGARSIITPARLAFGGIAAGAATAVAALNDYLEAQRNVQRGLIGVGRFSGASASDIGRIAGERASSTGFSVSEARDVALEFAKTGKMHKQVLGEMIETTRNFALVTGQSGQEAAQALGKAFTNMNALDALNAQFGFLDGASRTAIQRMLMFGKTTEAAALANQKLAEVLRSVPGTLSEAERGWTAVANAISNAWGALGEFIARQANLKPLNFDEQIQQLQARIATAEAARRSLQTLGRPTDGADAAIARMTAEMEKLNAERTKNAQHTDLQKLSLDATMAVQATDPLKIKIQEIEAALHKMNAARMAGQNIPGLQQAIQLETQKVDALRQQDALVTQLAAKYPGMSTETAKQLELLEAQRATVGNLSEDEQRRTEEMKRQIELMIQGKTALEAQAIAAAERANSELQSAAREEATAERDAANATERRARAAASAAASNERAAAAIRNLDTIGNSNGSFISMFASVAEMLSSVQRTGSAFATEPGQQSTSGALGASSADRLYGAGNYDIRGIANEGTITAAMPNQRYWDTIAQRAAQAQQRAAATFVDQGLAGSGVEATITSIINGALGPIMGQNAQQYIGALSGLVPQDRQQSVLEQYIERVRQEPVTLAREQLLRQLTDSLDQLKGSVDNLSDVFSPFYSSDPRQSNLGFRTFAGGGIMTAHGPMPLRQYDGGGIANSPQMAMFGEGSTPEAFVPVPSGRIPVEMRMPANSNQPITINQTFVGGANPEAGRQMKKSGFQLAQELKRAAR